MTHMYFSARAEGRISYGHLGRTDSCLLDIGADISECKINNLRLSNVASSNYEKEQDLQLMPNNMAQESANKSSV